MSGSLDAEMLSALAGRAPEHRSYGKTLGATSDLTIDETLLLHSIGWEPVDLVAGAAVSALPWGPFAMGGGDADNAATAFAAAIASAVKRIETEAHKHHGVGIIGVQLETKVTHHVIEVILTGSAVRPSDGSGQNQTPFVSDLNVRDFCLLHGAGWQPVGLAFGACFVRVPRRSAGQAIRQSTANVELTNMTTALYDARETGMERMQASAIALGGRGMVDVNVQERPLPFNGHIVEFRAWGTAIRLAGDSHRYLRPRMIVPLDDVSSAINVEALG